MTLFSCYCGRGFDSHRLHHFKENNMKNTLDPISNKTQALVKLEIAKENLEGVDQALSNYNRPKVELALAMVEDVLSQLSEEKKLGFKSTS